MRERTGLELDARSRRPSCGGCSTRSAGEDLAYGDVARVAGAAGRRPRHGAGNAGALAALPARRGRVGRGAARAVRHPAGRPPADRGLRRDRRGHRRRPGARRGRRPAGVAVRLRCWEPGTAKVTLGTGAPSCSRRRARRAPSPPAGILASCAWRREGATSYALEGFIPTAGAAARLVSAHRRTARPAPSSTRCCASRPGGVACVPAPGPREPDWTHARGALLGLSLSTTRADLGARSSTGSSTRWPTIEATGTPRGAVGRRRPLALGLDRPAPRGPRASPSSERRADSTALGAATLAARRRRLGPARGHPGDPARPLGRAVAGGGERAAEREQGRGARAQRDSSSMICAASSGRDVEHDLAAVDPRSRARNGQHFDPPRRMPPRAARSRRYEDGQFRDQPWSRRALRALVEVGEAAGRRRWAGRWSATASRVTAPSMSTQKSSTVLPMPP